MKKGSSVSGWNPGSGKGRDQGATNKLMSTEAKDGPETISATNEQKAFCGKSGKPTGKFGTQGTEF